MTDVSKTNITLEEYLKLLKQMKSAALNDMDTFPDNEMKSTGSQNMSALGLSLRYRDDEDCLYADCSMEHQLYTRLHPYVREEMKEERPILNVCHLNIRNMKHILPMTRNLFWTMQINCWYRTMLYFRMLREIFCTLTPILLENHFMWSIVGRRQWIRSILNGQKRSMDILRESIPVCISLKSSKS